MQNELVSFRLDDRCKHILDDLERQGYSKSKAIRKALVFYKEFNFDSETWELLNELAKKTKLPKRAVLVVGLRLLDEILKGGE